MKASQGAKGTFSVHNILVASGIQRREKETVPTTIERQRPRMEKGGPGVRTDIISRR